MMIQERKGLKSSNNTILFNARYMHHKKIIKEQQKREEE